MKLRIAESRADPNNKVYVQNLVKEDKEFFGRHLMKDNGVIFVCGGSEMAKNVESQIFEAIKLYEKIPFKAFKLLK